jgi:GNAT superfamily N-acetyltransferase
MNIAGRAPVRDFEDDAPGGEAFTEVAFTARRDDPRWIPSPRTSTQKQLSPSQPQWRYVARRFFFVVDGTRAARCAAFVNPRLVDAQGVPFGQIGFFECTPGNDDDGRRVLDAALAWLKDRGCRTVLGPMNGSTWHSYRFVVDWKDTSPLLLEPNNPLRYPALWEAHGFTRHPVPYYSGAHDNADVVQSLQAKHDAALAAGYRMDDVDFGDIPGVLKTMFELSTRIFADNAFYSDITWPEFAALYDGIERILDRRLVQWLKAPSGEIAGFAFGVPDQAEAARRMRGDTGWLGKFRFLTAPRAKRTLVKTIGILPEHRGQGLLGELYWSQARRALDGGWPEGVVTLMSGDNRSFTGGRSVQTVVREYALFTRGLA